MVAVLKSPEQPALFVLEKPDYTDFDLIRLQRLIRHMVLGDCLQWNGEQFIHDASDAGTQHYLLRHYRVEGKRSQGGGWRKVWKANIPPAKEESEVSERKFRARLDCAQKFAALELVKRGWKAERVTWVCGQMPN